MSDLPKDQEKGQILSEVKFDTSSQHTERSIGEGQILSIPSSWAKRFQATLRSELTETRGVSRVLPDARQPASTTQYVQMISLWTSANLTANHLALGLLGPKIYGLSFLDSALCATFGVLVGCMCTGYIAAFGPQSGNRTMIITRYHMGWWPSRLVVVLNLVIMIGYGMIDCVVGGQMISAVAGGENVSVVVGVIIVAVVTWTITVIGLPVLHIYERYGWIPQAAALLVLAGCAGPHFDLSAPSTGNSKTITANRISMFSLCLGASSAWSPAAADFYVYYPETTSKTLVFLLTWIGEALGYLFSLYLGIGIASGIPSNPVWSSANEVSPGAVLVAGFDSLGTFGRILATIVMLGVIANNAPGTYACGLGFQCLGSWPLKVPRMVWNSFAVLVYTVCAAAGRNHLYDIFQSFLSLMGYWCTIWVVITLEEQFIFRRTIGYNWADWNDRSKLPVGLAALATFLLSYVGAVLGMYQTYFVGPIALMVGDYGSDLGLLIGLSWAALLFPPLRYLEKKFIGR